MPQKVIFKELTFSKGRSRQSLGRNGKFKTRTIAVDATRGDDTIYFCNRSEAGNLTNGWVVLPRDPELLDQLIEQLKLIKTELQIDQLLGD